eukprot:1808729-Prorocentrum_lima.AAC.1
MREVEVDDIPEAQLMYCTNAGIVYRVDPFSRGNTDVAKVVQYYGVDKADKIFDEFTAKSEI